MHLSKNSGFTLIEMVVTVVIVVILGAIAIPTFSNLMSQNKLTGTANELLGAVSSARTEAIKNRSQVTLTPKNGSWINGWEIKVTATNNVVLERDAFNNSLSSSSQANKGAVTFNTNGFVNGSNPWGTGGVVFCDSKGKGRKVVLSISGSAKIQKVDSSCSV